jgi:hypothetical protein
MTPEMSFNEKEERLLTGFKSSSLSDGYVTILLAALFFSCKIMGSGTGLVTEMTGMACAFFSPSTSGV